MRRILAGCLLGLLFIIGTAGWKIYQVKQPFRPEEVPLWQVQEVRQNLWQVVSVADPTRTTNAWFAGNQQGLACDTLIMFAGVHQGLNLFSAREHLNDQGNTIVLEHPIRKFLYQNPLKTFGFWDWWNVAEILREEMLHTVGALQALIRYTNASVEGDQRFTDQVVVAGGSFGAPFSVAATSFAPEQVAGLILIYSFTDFYSLFHREFNRQGLIHFKLPKNPETVMNTIQVGMFKMLANGLASVFSQILKYGELEQYFPYIDDDTPIYFINGTIDRLISRDSYALMWNAAPEPKTETWIQGDHINPGNIEELKRVVDYMDVWSRENNLRNCHTKK